VGRGSDHRLARHGSRFVGPAGFRKWVEELRDAWARIESKVMGIEDFGHVLVVDTMVTARGRQDLDTGWRVYNVIWLRDGLVIRRRAFLDHAVAVETAKAEGRM
jgi:hypothetical protein